MKKLITLSFFFVAFVSNAQRTMFGAQNNYVAPVSSTIVSPSLKLHYDINNSSCYPGSGTTLTDLSGNGNHGTLMNSPSFANLSIGGGVLSFN
jgi:hypothetical protein